MSFFHNLVRRFSVGLLAVMSPGPDFVLTIRNSLVYSRRAGIYGDWDRRGSCCPCDVLPRWNWRNHSLHFACCSSGWGSLPDLHRH